MMYRLITVQVQVHQMPKPRVRVRISKTGKPTSTKPRRGNNITKINQST